MAQNYLKLLVAEGLAQKLPMGLQRQGEITGRICTSLWVIEPGAVFLGSLHNKKDDG